MKRTLVITLCVVALMIPALAALAALPQPNVKVTATSGGMTAAWTTTAFRAIDGGWAFNLDSPVLLTSGNTVLGRIFKFEAASVPDPSTLLAFGVEAGAAPVHFVIEGTQTFSAPVQPAFGRTAADMFLSAGPNGGQVTGNFANGNAYRASYNNDVKFAELLPSFSAGANKTTGEAGRFPDEGFAFITNEPVNSMKTAYDFGLSAGAQASGFAAFEVKPVPDANTLSLALLGGVPALAGYMLRRRRIA